MAVPFEYNLRSLLVRRTSSLAAAVGIALVVTVFVLVLAMASGFSWALRSAGSPENAMVLRKGSSAEITSGIQAEQAAPISALPQIAKGPDGRPLLVKEMVALVLLPRKGGDTLAQAVVRGTSVDALAVRPTVKVLPDGGGRMFRPGLPEIVVGRALTNRVKGLGLGETIEFRRQTWTVVGVLDSGGSGFESEIWGDVSVLQGAFNRQGAYQSMTFRMADPSPAAFQALKELVEGDPSYQATTRSEEQYYADQAGTLSTFMKILGTLVTVIMSVGAVFGAMNTMYAAVGSRAREIATLRALGFRRSAILVSFLGESLVLAGAGGLLGCLFALPLNGLTTSTINWDTFSELAFAFRVTPGTLAAGFTFALVMGAVGGFLPAVQAARRPIVTGLRQV